MSYGELTTVFGSTHRSGVAPRGHHCRRPTRAVCSPLLSTRPLTSYWKSTASPTRMWTLSGSPVRSIFARHPGCGRQSLWSVVKRRAAWMRRRWLLGTVAAFVCRAASRSLRRWVCGWLLTRCDLWHHCEAQPES